MAIRTTYRDESPRTRASRKNARRVFASVSFSQVGRGVPAEPRTSALATSHQPQATSQSPVQPALLASYVYAPFGAVTSSSGVLAATNPFRFSSEYHDDTLGLVYYNYRHYNPADGRWTSRDPIGEEGGANLYGFCGNDRFKYDSLGRWFGWDDAIAASIGAVIGITSQAVIDVWKQEFSGWEAYVGGAISGALMGEAMLYAPALSVAEMVGIGATSAFLGDFTTQTLEIGTGRQKDVDPCELMVSVGMGATFSAISSSLLQIEGVTFGRNSMVAVSKQLTTKFCNKTIKSTTVKSTIGSVLGQEFNNNQYLTPLQIDVSAKLSQEFRDSSATNHFNNALGGERFQFSQIFYMLYQADNGEMHYFIRIMRWDHVEPIQGR